MTCQTCRALADEIVLTDAPRVDLDEHWRVEHCYPVAVTGWLVLVLRRHARALHDLTDDEAASLGHWLPAVARALHAATDSEVEYVMQFAESAGFQHVHFHLVARPPDWPDDLQGPGVWAAFGVPNPVSSSKTTRVMEALALHLGLSPQPSGPLHS